MIKNTRIETKAIEYLKEQDALLKKQIKLEKMVIKSKEHNLLLKEGIKVEKEQLTPKQIRQEKNKFNSTLRHDFFTTVSCTADNESETADDESEEESLGNKRTCKESKVITSFL